MSELSTEVKSTPSQEVLTLLLDHARANFMGKTGYQRYNAMLYINHLLDRWLEGQGEIPEPPIEVPEEYYRQTYDLKPDGQMY
jgi:hypothetical protein